MWAEQGSNLRTRERTDLQSVAFNRSAICPGSSPIISNNYYKNNRIDLIQTPSIIESQ